MNDPSVVSLDQFRRKRARRPSDMIVGCCMWCGGEFEWGNRFDHRCEEESRANHPSSKS